MIELRLSFSQKEKRQNTGSQILIEGCNFYFRREQGVS